MKAPNNKVHFHTEKDDVSLYGTPKEEVGTVNTSRFDSQIFRGKLVI